VLVDYWLAGYLGRAWLWLTRGSRRESGDLPGLCAAVARGKMLPARTLERVQNFAGMSWLRVSFAAVPGVVVGGEGGKALFGAAGVVSFGSVFALIAAIGGGQMVAAMMRGNGTRGYLRKADASAGAFPLPPGSPGLPQRTDFWVALALAVIVGGILLVAGLRSAP